MKNIGEIVELTLLRNGRSKQIRVEIGTPLDYGSSTTLHPLLEGVRFEMHEQEQWLIVAQLEPGSIGSRSGLQVGDIVVGANKRRVKDLGYLKQALEINRRSVLLYINRNGYLLYLVIR